MEEKSKILFAWERDRPVCIVEKIKDGALTVTFLREPDIKLRAEPSLRKRGYKDKLVFLPAPSPPSAETKGGGLEKGPGEEDEFKLVIGDDGYAMLNASTKLLIVIPNEDEKIPPPVLIDTIPLTAATSYKEEKSNGKVTKKV